LLKLGIVFLILVSGLTLASALEKEIVTPEGLDARTTSVVARAMFAERSDDLHLVCVVSDASGSNVYYFKYNNASRRWSSGLALTEGGDAENAAISGDYMGNLHCVWEDEGRIYHRMWNATSEEWDKPFLVSENASDPIVICDRAPNTHVLWIQSDDSTPRHTFIVHRYVDAYGKWSEPSTVSPKTAFCGEMAAAVDRRNGLHVVWKMTFDSGKPYDMFYAYRQAGREWSPFQRILDGSEVTMRNPAIAADPDNFVHVVWEQDVGGTSQIFYRAWKGGWEEPRRLTNSSGSATHPVIETDDGENIHVVWEDTRSHPNSDLGEVYYKRLWPMGLWTLPYRLTEDRGSQGTPPRLEVSPRSRDLHIVWSDVVGGRNRVFHMIWPGQRHEDASRAASRAMSEISDVRRQPFVSPKAKAEFDEALKAYQSGLDSLKRFDIPNANDNFKRCLGLIEKGRVLEEEYKEQRGKMMGISLAGAGMVAGVVVLVAWGIYRRRM